MNLRSIALVVAAVAVLALSACSDEVSRFRDVGAVTATLENAGVSCTKVRISTPGSLVKEQGACDEGSDVTSVYVFESAADRHEWISVGSAFGTLVVGPEWVVVVPHQEVVQEVAEITGGEVL